MLKYLTILKPDFESFLTEIKELMENPIDFFVNRPEEAKAFCVVSFLFSSIIISFEMFFILHTRRRVSS